MSGAVAGVVVEGAVDRFCGRPLDQNPYAHGLDAFAAWELGWREADELLAMRGAEEAARWLSEPT